MTRSLVCAFALLISLSDNAPAADLTAETLPSYSQIVTRAVVSGKVAVVDGRTLWFPTERVLVRLSEIDSCDLVQWSFDPRATPLAAPSLAPVPCGALAKAWLKRSIGHGRVRCDAIAYGSAAELTGKCQVGNRDLALEMLRVGWAKVSRPVPQDRRYIEAQRLAMVARYGMWATYVLDMPEWRGKAIDKTLGRKPLADINLLGERESEISPPFIDARRQPGRRDR
ncbi:thermonuclease family protein [Agrobacterium fabrum]|uniref:thermonuclease family protein n=1 Tax=Agrobacterium fabrum TaxID=1176649 RepID=UPI003BA0B771